MSAETIQTLLEVARLVAVALITALITAFVTNRLTVNRERQSGRENRKREFHLFVTHLKAECEHHSPALRFDNFYQEKIPALRREAANIEADFRGNQRRTFNSLVDDATKQESPRRVIVALNAILDFLK